MVDYVRPTALLMVASLYASLTSACRLSMERESPKTGMTSIRVSVDTLNDEFENILKHTVEPHYYGHLRLRDW